MNTNGTTPATQRAAQLADKIRAALALLGLARDVVAGDDIVIIGDIQLAWTESWLTLKAAGGERYGGQAGWEVRLLPAAMPSGIVHNDRSAIQQVCVLIVLDMVAPVLDALPPAKSNELPDTGE